MHSHRILPGILAVFLALALPALRAQQAQGEAGSQTVVHAWANLVLVDVVVTDHGKPVHGLEQGQFHIFEDNKEQSIFSFDEHRPAGGAADAMKPPQLPPNTYTNMPVFPEQSAVNVLLIDALNTPMGAQLRVRQQMIQYLKQIEPGTTMAVFTLSSQLRMITGFTSDVARLATIMTAPKATPQPSALMDTVDMGGTASPATGVLPNSPSPPSTAGNIGTDTAPIDAAEALSLFQSDVMAEQANIRMRVTLGAFQELAQYLSGIPGRKNLIWLSGSFPLMILPDSALSGGFRNVTDYSEEIKKTTDMLTVARVAIYPVDALGLQVPSGFNAGIAGVPNNTHAGAQLEQRSANEGTMAELADQTGGRAYFEANDLKGAVENAVESGENYYTIGYVPASAKMNGDFRKIKMSVEAPDVKLFYRRGYYADAADRPSAHGPGKISSIAAAALHGAPPATEIVFEAGLLADNDPLLKNVRLPSGPAGEMSDSLKKPMRFVVDLTLNPHSFDLYTLPDGSRQVKADLVLIAYDDDGGLVNYVDHAVQLGIQPQQFERVVENGLPLLIPIDLPAGEDWLRVTVEDLNTGRKGSMEIPVTVKGK